MKNAEIKMKIKEFIKNKNCYTLNVWESGTIYYVKYRTKKQNVYEISINVPKEINEKELDFMLDLYMKF